MPLIGVTPWTRSTKRSHATRALVLRWVAFSNTSQIVTAFTRDFGVLSLLAKGSLRLARASSSFGSPFDLAGWYDIVVRPRSGEVDLVTEARLVEGFPYLRRSLPVLLDASFGIEILAKMFRPGDPQPDALRGALSFLKLLPVPGARLPLRIHLVQTLLSEAGWEPDWGSCAECGLPWQGEARALRLPCGLVCEACSEPGEDAGLPPQVIVHLLGACEIPWGAVPSRTASHQVLQDAWQILRRILLFHLEAAPRTLKFLRP